MHRAGAEAARQFVRQSHVAAADLEIAFGGFVGAEILVGGDKSRNVTNGFTEVGAVDKFGQRRSSPDRPSGAATSTSRSGRVAPVRAATFCRTIPRTLQRFRRGGE
jgi:hypothetical protein